MQIISNLIFKAAGNGDPDQRVLELDGHRTQFDDDAPLRRVDAYDVIVVPFDSDRSDLFLEQSSCLLVERV